MNESMSDYQLSQLSDFVASAIGLNFPCERWGDLGRQTELAAKEFGFVSAETFSQWLLSAPMAREQIEMLASYLTISETYFWREPHVFEALRDQVLPDLIRARKTGDRRLRIWSAGCATGEEPYSIAILLRHLIPDLENWHITLLATDINPHILQRAAVGVYGNWSFRNEPPGFKEKYFVRAGNEKFEILPEIRKMVTFEYLNLAEDIYPSPMNNTNAMDVIFCRNVLMYFLPERSKQIGLRFYGSLLEGGWLIVGAGELSQQIFPQFVSVRFPGALIYHREHEKSRPPASEAALTHTLAPAKPHSPYPREQPRPTKAVKTTKEEMPPDAALVIRTLANKGKLDEARIVCGQAIAADKLNIGLYYLDATILQEQDREDEAVAALKRALYIDQNFVPAHFILGNLLLRQGNALAAKKSFENALELLNAYGQEDIIPESEGLTAGRLREIISATLYIGVLV